MKSRKVETTKMTIKFRVFMITFIFLPQSEQVLPLRDHNLIGGCHKYVPNKSPGRRGFHIFLKDRS